MSAGRRRQGGFTYIAVLIAVAVMGAGMAAFGEIASHAAQRDREAELLFAGQQYRNAIGTYYRKEERYPATLNDLLEDRRYPTPVRHLRKLYPDPFTGSNGWGLIEAPEGGIMGVYSRSEKQPIKTGNFGPADENFDKAATHAEWKFFYKPPSPVGSKATG